VRTLNPVLFPPFSYGSCRLVQLLQDPCGPFFPPCAWTYLGVIFSRSLLPLGHRITRVGVLVSHIRSCPLSSFNPRTMDAAQVGFFSLIVYQRKQLSEIGGVVLHLHLQGEMTSRPRRPFSSLPVVLLQPLQSRVTLPVPTSSFLWSWHHVKRAQAFSL